MKQIPKRYEAIRREAHGQEVGAVLAGMTREYWRASLVLRSYAIDRPCDQATALRFLVNLALCGKYGRLRCIAAGTLVSLGLTPTQLLASAPGARPAA